jgi:hypothetical protein
MLRLRNLLIATLFFSATWNNALLAQDDMRFGLMVSPSVNWFTASADDYDSGSRFRLSYGLMADFFLTDRYAINSGFVIASRGADLNLMDTAGTYTLNLIEIPIALKMRTQQFDRMTYFAKFGGTIGFKTGEEVKLTPDRTEEAHLNNYFTPIHTQFMIGLGAEYEVDGSSAVVFGLDYVRSLNDSLRDADPRIGKRDDYRLWGLQLTIGFFF